MKHLLGETNTLPIISLHKAPKAQSQSPAEAMQPLHIPCFVITPSTVGRDPSLLIKGSFVVQYKAIPQPIYYGPLGGKWADPEHTIPWKETSSKQPSAGEYDWPEQTTLPKKQEYNWPEETPTPTTETPKSYDWPEEEVPKEEIKDTTQEENLFEPTSYATAEGSKTSTEPTESLELESWPDFQDELGLEHRPPPSKPIQFAHTATISPAPKKFDSFEELTTHIASQHAEIKKQFELDKIPATQWKERIQQIEKMAPNAARSVHAGLHSWTISSNPTIAGVALDNSCYYGGAYLRLLSCYLGMSDWDTEKKNLLSVYDQQGHPTYEKLDDWNSRLHQSDSAEHQALQVALAHHAVFVDYMKAIGQPSVKIYRGVTKISPDVQPKIESGNINQTAASSWADHEGTARMFTGSFRGPLGTKNYLFEFEIPVECVLTGHQTNDFLRDEAELIVGSSAHASSIKINDLTSPTGSEQTVYSKEGPLRKGLNMGNRNPNKPEDDQPFFMDSQDWFEQFRKFRKEKQSKPPEPEPIAAPSNPFAKSGFIPIRKTLGPQPIFYGPLGGKWADPEHTIPWKETSSQQTTGAVGQAGQSLTSPTQQESSFPQIGTPPTSPPSSTSSSTALDPFSWLDFGTLEAPSKPVSSTIPSQPTPSAMPSKPTPSAISAPAGIQVENQPLASLTHPTPLAPSASLTPLASPTPPIATSMQAEEGHAAGINPAPKKFESFTELTNHISSLHAEVKKQFGLDSIPADQWEARVEHINKANPALASTVEESLDNWIMSSNPTVMGVDTDDNGNYYGSSYLRLLSCYMGLADWESEKGKLLSIYDQEGHENYTKLDDWNNRIRQPGTAEHQALQVAIAHHAIFVDYMKQSGNHSVRVYRGVTNIPPELQPKIESGNINQTAASSWSEDGKAAKEFTRAFKEKEGTKRYMFEFEIPVECILTGHQTSNLLTADIEQVVGSTDHASFIRINDLTSPTGEEKTVYSKENPLQKGLNILDKNNPKKPEDEQPFLMDSQDWFDQFRKFRKQKQAKPSEPEPVPAPSNPFAKSGFVVTLKN